MSKIKIQGSASGTGTLTIQAPTTSTDRTLSIPDSSGTILDNTSTLDATKLSGNLPAISGASLTNVNAVNGGRKNILINGDYRISQRGDYTSATSVTNGAYLLDRAKNYLVGVTGTAQQLTNQVVNGTYENTWKYVATSSASGRIGSYQLVEDWYKGETLTLSAWVKSNNANARIVVYDGATNTSSSTHTGGGAWEKLTVTATQSASAGQLYVYSAIISSSVGSVSISSSDYIETAMFQLERGSTATNFERRHTGEELALCQRYFYHQVTNGSGEGYTYVLDGNHYPLLNVNFPVTMRAEPSYSSNITSSHRFRIDSVYDQYGAWHEVNTVRTTNDASVIVLEQNTNHVTRDLGVCGWADSRAGTIIFYFDAEL